MATRLSEATLSALPATLERPRYDRARLTPGIVHIGLGNFHRAHQAWHLHRLMQEGRALDWAILGAGVRLADAQMRERLLAQDCLTTLIELAPDHMSAEVIGSMVDFLPVTEGHAPLIAAMAAPQIRIVALTITEGGYYTDPATGGVDLGHPDLAHDAVRPQAPKTAFGAIVEALRRRRDQGARPFTVLSCDNLQSNGAVARGAVVSLAERSSPELAAWIAAEGAFPNSMVDCIVPATGPGEIALAQSLGVEDAAPVTHENFRQWVIEDAFCAGRPDWDRAGAVFSDHVHAYEQLKIRVLNAGHQVLANAGELLDLAEISHCMAHPLISAMFRKVQAEEITPYVAGPPGVSTRDYLALIERRFANPAIRDTTRRVAFDGLARHKGFVLPILRDALAAGGPFGGLSLVEALWARMCAGVRDNGAVIGPNDPQWAALQAAALAAKDDPRSWLGQSEIYGGLASNAPFAEAFGHWLALIWSEGTEAALRVYLGGDGR